MTYRKDIDGLRAIAVLSVILFHFFPNLLPGGFLGVDIFFVISGFLITGIIYDQRKAGDFSYAGFYERRIRRLLPALVATFLLCIGAAVFIYDAEQMSDFGGSMIHALFGLSNFYFYFETDYFGMQAAARPLLHTWTLSVEEQFYLLWPLFLWALVKLPVVGRICLIVAVIAASTGIGEYQLAKDPAAAFYLLPARVAELAMGGLAAVVFREYRLPARFDHSNKFITVLHLASLAFLIWALVYYDYERFPGWIALPPAIAIGTLLLVPIRGPLSVVLTNPISRWIGLISYSAYLIHWPLLVFYQAFTVRPITMVEGVILIFATLVLASLFYVCVEQPFRYKHGGRTKIRNGAMGFSAVASVVTISMFSAHAWVQKPWTNALKAKPSIDLDMIMETRRRSFAQRQRIIDQDDCHQFTHERDDNFDHCLKRDADRYNVLIIGSSYGADDWIMLREAYPDANIQRITAQVCMVTRKYVHPHCMILYDYMQRSFDKINRFDLVVLSHNWDRNYNMNFIGAFVGKLEAPTVIFGPRGNLSAESYKIIERGQGGPNLVVGDDFVVPTEFANRELLMDFSKNNNLGFVDMYALLRDEGQLPLMISDKDLLFYDYGHYTPKSAKYIARKFVAKYPEITDLEP